MVVQEPLKIQEQGGVLLFFIQGEAKKTPPIKRNGDYTVVIHSR